MKPGRDSGSVSDKPSYSKICQQRLEARREGMPSQSLCPAASTSALASRAVCRSFRFKPPGLWSFVAKALGREHTSP